MYSLFDGFCYDLLTNIDSGLVFWATLYVMSPDWPRKSQRLGATPNVQRHCMA